MNQRELKQSIEEDPNLTDSEKARKLNALCEPYTKMSDEELLQLVRDFTMEYGREPTRKDVLYKLYPIKWTHLFHNFLLFGHRFFIGIPINWTYFLFKTLFLGHTFACVSSIIGLHTEVIQMTNYHCPTRFTPEQMKVLSANPFTYKVSAIYIHYTLEFKNLFLAHYEAGEPVKDIFAAFGYDPAILGDNRMYAFARRISKQAKEGKVPTEDSSSVKIQKPAKVDYNTLPAQQSVSAMQREIAYLRQQIEFLKKITELDNDRKPRT